MKAIFILIPVLFLIIFPAMFAMVTKLLSIIGGWGRLASFYGSGKEYKGPFMEMQSARMGIVRYNSILKVGTDTSSLFLRVMVLFRVGHPDLAVPLHEVHGQERSGFFGRRLRLTFVKAPGVSMTITKKLGDLVEQLSGGSWRYERLKQ